MRIFIASADQKFRFALQMLLEDEPGMVVIGMTDRADGLPIQVGASHAEVLLIDWELAGQAALDLIDDVQRLEHQPKIIALSIDPHLKETALAAGAYYFISKDVPPDDLLPTLRRIRLSEPMVSAMTSLTAIGIKQEVKRSSTHVNPAE
jgi:DNA-binding NarL/FixJ family response regulator